MGLAEELAKETIKTKGKSEEYLALVEKARSFARRGEFAIRASVSTACIALLKSDGFYATDSVVDWEGSAREAVDGMQGNLAVELAKESLRAVGNRDDYRLLVESLRLASSKGGSTFSIKGRNLEECLKITLKANGFRINPFAEEISWAKAVAYSAEETNPILRELDAIDREMSEDTLVSYHKMPKRKKGIYEKLFGKPFEG